MSKLTNISKKLNLPQIEEDAEIRKGTENLYRDVCDIIDNVRGEIANYVNTKICLTKWDVGNRIKEDVLFNRRAEYGKQIIKNLAVKLTAATAGMSAICDIVYALRTLLLATKLCTHAYTI